MPNPVCRLYQSDNDPYSIESPKEERNLRLAATIGKIGSIAVDCIVALNCYTISRLIVSYRPQISRFVLISASLALFLSVSYIIQKIFTKVIFSAFPNFSKPYNQIITIRKPETIPDLRKTFNDYLNSKNFHRLSSDNQPSPISLFRWGWMSEHLINLSQKLKETNVDRNSPIWVEYFQIQVSFFFFTYQLIEPDHNFYVSTFGTWNEDKTIFSFYNYREPLRLSDMTGNGDNDQKIIFNHLSPHLQTGPQEYSPYQLISDDMRILGDQLANTNGPIVSSDLNDMKLKIQNCLKRNDLAGILDFQEWPKETNEIPTMFRKTSLKCHPDKYREDSDLASLLQKIITQAREDLLRLVPNS